MFLDWLSMIHLCTIKVYWEVVWPPVINALQGKTATFAPTHIDLVITYSQKPKTVDCQHYFFLDKLIYLIQLIKCDSKDILI